MGRIKCTADKNCKQTFSRAVDLGRHQFFSHGIKGKSRSANTRRRQQGKPIIPAVTSIGRSSSIDYPALVSSLREEWHAVNAAISQLEKLQMLQAS